MSAPSSVAPASLRPGRLRWLTGAWRALSLRDAVMVSTVPLIAIVILIGDAVVRYERALQFRDFWSFQADVTTYLTGRIAEIRALPRRVALRQRFSADAADAGIIRLEVPRQSWDSIQGDPLAMWGQWVGGTLRYGGTALDVRLRKRGDNSVHWLGDKRSLTIRTSRDEFYKRYRAFGLSVKDVLPSYLANRLASEFGLMAPTTTVVPVFLNNQFYGMFRFVEVVDESFLRPFDRMPGNIFRGDAAQRGSFYKGAPRNLFSNPYIWERPAKNERWTSAGPGQLTLLLQDIRGGTFPDHQRMMARLDRDEFARLFAFAMLVGDPYHMDGVHNWFLYEDPTTQLLHPIPWDIRLRDIRRREAPLNDLFGAVLRDPFVVDGVVRELKTALDERGVERVADSLVTAAERRYHDFFEYDRARSGLIAEVGSVSESIDLIRSNVRQFRQLLARDTVAFRSTRDARGLILDFETRGLVGADLVALRIDHPVGTPRLYLDRNLNGELDGNDPEVPLAATGEAYDLGRAVELLPGWNTGQYGFDPGQMPYRLFVTGLSGGAVEPVLVNRATRKPSGLVEWDQNALIGPPTGWHPWRYPTSTGKTVRFAGEVRLAETVRVGALDTLVIAPGATLRLAPDVSIVSRGLVRAIGTHDRPIRVVPADSSRPWGTFALMGPGANRSVVRNVEFFRGGGALVDRVEYIGMVNVHLARGVVFDSVTFRENLRSDDTFHALHSEIDLVRSRFIKANSDAADLDISTGQIRDNIFEGSGGDAIDLMTSTPRVFGNRIRNAGDKGISIGEASAPVVFNNLIEDSQIGIEVKDRSTPVILSNELRRNKLGFRTRMKNWRYGGSGWGTIVNTSFEESGKRISIDSLGRLTTRAVVGLDTVTTAPEPARLDWLYAAHGIAIDEPKVGRPTKWHPIPVVPPLVDLRYEDGFGSIADGWRGGSRITRLEKRRDALVVEAEGGAATIERAVKWDLGEKGGVLALELAGRDLQRVRVVAVGANGSVAEPVTPSGTLSAYTLVEVKLPPDRYRTLRIEIEPTPGLSHIQRNTGLSVLRAGRLDLRGYSVYPAGAPDSAR